MRRPLYHWALLLTALAIPLSDRSPWCWPWWAFRSCSTVKSLPRIEWLYGTVAALWRGLLLPLAEPTDSPIELIGGRDRSRPSGSGGWAS